MMLRFKYQIRLIQFNKRFVTYYIKDKLDENTQRTRDALEKICNDKISASMPGQCAKKQAPAQYIRYRPIIN